MVYFQEQTVSFKEGILVYFCWWCLMYCIFIFHDILANGEHIDLRNRALGDHGSSFSKQLCLAFGKRGEFVCSSVDLVSSGGFQSFSCEEKVMAILECLCELYVFFFEIICSCFVSPNVLASEVCRMVCVCFPIGHGALRSCVVIANWCWAVCRRRSFHWTKMKTWRMMFNVCIFKAEVFEWGCGRHHQILSCMIDWKCDIPKVCIYLPEDSSGRLKMLELILQWDFYSTPML